LLKEPSPVEPFGQSPFGTIAEALAAAGVLDDAAAAGVEAAGGADALLEDAPALGSSFEQLRRKSAKIVEANAVVVPFRIERTVLDAAAGDQAIPLCSTALRHAGASRRTMRRVVCGAARLPVGPLRDPPAAP
jgi:hypothetical protein